MAWYSADTVMSRLPKKFPVSKDILKSSLLLVIPVMFPTIIVSFRMTFSWYSKSALALVVNLAFAKRIRMSALSFSRIVDTEGV